MAGTVLSVVLLVSGVVVMLVLHILIVVWALRRGFVVRRSAPPREDDEESGGKAAPPEGLSDEELGELPCHERKASAAGDGGDCAVCLEAFQAGDRCRVLPGCEHGFHAQCVDSWLRKSRVCPICRAEVVIVVVGRRLGKAAEAVVSDVVAERQGGADR